MNKKKFLLIKDSTYNYENDYYIFCLSQAKTLDSIIGKLNSKESIINFKYNLNNFISFFNVTFKFLKKREIYFKLLLDYESPTFLLSTDDNNYIFVFKKYCIKSFYDNIRFIYKYDKMLFRRIGIKRNMSLNNEKDVNTIFNFMMDIIHFNKDKYQLFFVFENYRVFIDDKKIYYAKKKKKYNEDNIVNDVYHNICDNWDILIDKYAKKNNKI